MIPTPETINSEWLTEQLQRHGYDTLVTGFEQQPVGTGQIGLCIRYDLETSGGDAPTSLIGKFPSPDPQSRATGIQLRNYLKEVSFYQQLQHRLQISTPRCYFAEIVDEGPEFMLLLEDLAPAIQGDQLEGCSVEVARSAVLELVGLHSPFWNSAELSDYTSFLGASSDSGGGLKPMYQALFPGFIERYGSQLSGDQQQILGSFGERLDRFQQTSQPDHLGLVHIDYRLDNLLIDEGVSPPGVTVVDWQSITIGNPMTDVGYFLGAGLLPEIRREADREIVQAYHDRLLASGHSDYGFDRCWEDYRRAAFAGFSVTVVASMIVQQTQRGDQMFTAMAQRHSQHALDLGAAEFLD